MSVAAYKTRLYMLWRNLFKRRRIGIDTVRGQSDVVARWLSFQNFEEDMPEPPHAKKVYLRKLSYAKPHGPGNTVWATTKNGIPKSDYGHNAVALFKGEFRNLQDLVEEHKSVNGGILRCHIEDRIAKGWSVERALTTPMKKHTTGTLLYKGESVTVRQASQLGARVEQHTLRRRIKLGWSVEEAIETPVPKGGGRFASGKNRHDTLRTSSQTQVAGLPEHAQDECLPGY